MKPPLERLMAKTIPEPNSGCLLWCGSDDGEYGYGRMTIGSRIDGSRRIVQTHRLSWELHFGAIPEDMLVLHKCDVPACVNPRHLYLGTNGDNTRDKMVRGRARTKLNAEAVIAIRKMAIETDLSHEKIGKQFGISQPSTSAAIRGKSWAHVKGELS
jgi:hypothetical protein